MFVYLKYSMIQKNELGFLGISVGIPTQANSEILLRWYSYSMTFTIRDVFILQLRSALDRIDELEASNSHLTKRLEKMKANRSALLAQQ